MEFNKYRAASKYNSRVKRYENDVTDYLHDKPCLFEVCELMNHFQCIV